MESLDAAKKLISEAAGTVDKGIQVASKAATEGAASAIALSQNLYIQSLPIVSQSAEYLHTGLQHYRQAEDLVFSKATSGLQWMAVNPYISYPVAGLSALLLLPFSRRLLYRQTIGKLSSPEVVVRSCEGRSKGISAKMEDYSNQVDKLQVRMISAEAEYKEGLANLRATRKEMQRLSSSLTKGAISASGVLKELRPLSPKLENVLQIRSEAATNAATLKSQRDRVNKWIRRISNLDV